MAARYSDLTCLQRLLVLNRARAEGRSSAELAELEAALDAADRSRSYDRRQTREQQRQEGSCQK